MANNRLPITLVAIALVLAGTVFAWIEFGPTPAAKETPLTDEARAYISNLALDDVTMSAKLNYFSQKALQIEGKITNKGGRVLNIVEVTCIFRDTSGQILIRQRAPIVSQRMGGLQPSETKGFVLPFDNVPDGWNQQMPQLVIAAIDFS